MSDKATASGKATQTNAQASQKTLKPAAARALAEAEERRRQALADKRPSEVAGHGGLDPVRYGDWEVKGIASDF
jgi:hypothetical protein